MATRTNRIDFEIANLSGGLFADMPRQELPLTTFGLHGKVIEPVDAVTTAQRRRARLDSLAPMAFRPAMDVDAPAARRSASWLPGAVLAASALSLVATAFIAHPRAPEAAAAATQVEAATQVAAPPATQVEAPPAATQVEVSPVAAPARAAVPAKAPVASRAVTPAAPAPAAPTAAAPFSTADLPEIPPAPRPADVPFARAAAAVAIAGAGLRGASCRDAEAGSLPVPVTVTFAPSGRATGATVDGGALAGTPEASCLAKALRGATVPAFDGEPVAVHTTVHMR